MPEKPAAEQAAEDQATQDKPAADQAEDQATAEQAKPLAPAKPATPEEQQLQKDTARLLQLAQELKVEVEKAGANTLSLVAVRKADEVLRLSKNLKERMKERGQAPQSKTQ